MISKIALDKDTRNAVMAIVTKQAEIDWKDLATYSGIGAVGSGLTGGLVSHLSSDEKDPKKKMKNTLHSMLTSSVLGGAAGAGAYGAQSLIPGLGTPAETLHGSATANLRPDVVSGENAKLLAQSAPIVAGGHGAWQDIKDAKATNGIKAQLSDPFSSQSKDYAAAMQKYTGGNAAAQEAARTEFNAIKNKLSHGSEAAGTRLGYEALKNDRTHSQIADIANELKGQTGPLAPGASYGLTPEHTKGLSPAQIMHLQDLARQQGADIPGAITNVSTRAPSGLGKFDVFERGAVNLAGKPFGGNTASNILSSHTFKQGVPALAASGLATWLSNLVNNNASKDSFTR